MRRGASALLVAGGLVVLLVSYIVYTQHLVAELRREALRSGRMYARVYAALGDPREDGSTGALLDLSRHIREMGVPVIVTDASGRVAAAANLPFEAPLDDPRVAAFVKTLDEQNPPVAEESVGTVHYGNPPLVVGLRIIPALQAATLGILLLAGVYVLRTRSHADRERVWAGMARESAHQLATPLSSLGGWVELFEERASDDATTVAIRHMRADLERLERVAHRFERIGRPSKREPVDVGEVAERVAAYFRARVPTLAHAVTIGAQREAEPLVVRGDPVLLEWALESIVKNAVDALAGRGGRVDVHARRRPEGGVVVSVRDDGPGIPRELRKRIFEPGFSTKQRGWGIGLPLARRIVEEGHRGEVRLADADGGATFEVILPE